ncbi:MAG: tetratricopeptide repeat protein [Treponema sp.]|jgi:Tfp pilus assembly protein PilF|nr:tetratricopeptide repeat protein [Treponema sp.]
MKLFPLVLVSLLFFSCSGNRPLSFEIISGPGGEDIVFTPGGFYDGPPGAEAFVTVKTKKESYSLQQFAESLHRPDMVEKLRRDEAAGGSQAPGGEDLFTLLRPDKAPPRLSLLELRRISGSLMEAVVKAADSGGGVGKLLVFRGGKQGQAFPFCFYDIAEMANKTYQEKGKTCYELSFTFSPEPGPADAAPIGISAFNKDISVESERLWIHEPPGAAELPDAANLPAAANLPGAAKPVLHIVRGEGALSATLTGLLSAQGEGRLYSKTVFYDNPAGLGPPGIAAGISEDDVFVYFVRPAGIDSKGDYYFFTDNKESGQANLVSPKAEVLEQPHIIPGKCDFLEYLAGIKARRILLVINGSDFDAAENNTAFVRLEERLGSTAALAVTANGREAAGPDSGEENAALFPNGSFAAGGSKAADGSEEPGNGGQLLSAASFIAFLQSSDSGAANDSFAAGGSPEPRKRLVRLGGDFPILDLYAGFGEIKMQTMFSGLVYIDGSGEAPSVLGFGETLRKKLPPGRYAVTMTYRNGHRETKPALLSPGASQWVIFNYTPDLLEGDFSKLPAFGVHISELNPGNYKTHNPDALKAMEVPAWRISFLAGEDFYKKGDYPKAVAEYSASISLKDDNITAHVSRGNGYRKMGEIEKAIADYSKALSLQKDYAEVYNYRGYLYSALGDHRKAVADYTNAIKYRKNYADAFFNRGCAWAELEEWDNAAFDFGQVIRLEPQNATAYTERALAWQNKGDFKKAEADFAAAKKF